MPTSRHQPPSPACRARAAPTQPRWIPPTRANPKRPSFTSSPRNPRRFIYCAAISGFSTLNPGPNPTKRSTHNRAHRHPPILTNVRSRRPDPANTHPLPPTPISTCRRLKSSVLRYLDFRPGLGPDLRDIAAQYSSDNPNPESQERDVVHEPVRCPTAPRDVCCDIACFGPRFTSWLEISQHTSPGLRGSRCVWVSTVLLYLKI